MGRYGDSIAIHEYKVYGNLYRRCPDCKRLFDLTDTTDAAEWQHGHDCEV